jgi:pyrroloquinoline quinone biosynthesis protein B
MRFRKSEGRALNMVCDPIEIFFLKWSDFVEHLGRVMNRFIHQHSGISMFYGPKRIIFWMVFCLSPIWGWCQVELHVLGVTQDAGLPQLGCVKSCCVHDGKPRERIPVVSLGITQSDPKKGVLIEATPDINHQWQQFTKINRGIEPSSVFITHAHMGHYSGLLQLGREARNTKGVAVYGHPTLTEFLQRDQPWKQLVTLKNITPDPISMGSLKTIGELTITPIQVPHRDEISATYAYLIKGPSKTALFLPDIDKWEKWNLSIDSLVRSVDYAFLDATFFDETELPGRNLKEIPHPTVRETMERAKSWLMSVRQKVYLIHFNHTNPLLQKESEVYRTVIDFGFKVTEVGARVEL